MYFHSCVQSMKQRIFANRTFKLSEIRVWFPAKKSVQDDYFSVLEFWNIPFGRKMKQDYTAEMNGFSFEQDLILE